MSSKNVLNNLGHDERDLELIKLLNEQKTDSAAVLIGAGMLEDDLGSLLRSYCLRDIGSIKKFVDPLFEVYAPFSTFSAKINVSCALGLISLQKQRTLDLIRKLRNDFAHERKVVSFQIPKYELRLREILKSAKYDEEIEDFAQRAGRVFDERGIAQLTRVAKREFSDRLGFCFCVARTSSYLLTRREVRLLAPPNAPDMGLESRHQQPG
jgi:DNA-binding MltR family transcriptional regulator